MALIVEDGSGKPDAESYCSVLEADTYHAKRGNDRWAALTEQAKEQKLVQATDFMLQDYHGLWKGERRVVLQALDWPRSGVVISDTDAQGYYKPQVDYNIVPVEVKNACAELALRAIMGALNVDQTQSVTEKTVGPITVKYESGSSAVKSYRAVDMLLRRYFKASSGNSMVRLSRC